MLCPQVGANADPVRNGGTHADQHAVRHGWPPSSG